MRRIALLSLLGRKEGAQLDIQFRAAAIFLAAAASSFFLLVGIEGSPNPLVLDDEPRGERRRSNHWKQNGKERGFLPNNLLFPNLSSKQGAMPLLSRHISLLRAWAAPYGMERETAASVTPLAPPPREELFGILGMLGAVHK